MLVVLFVMENHPIPQDITGFQFKLIGKMTIKQFVYLAVGAVFAWLFFFIIDFPTLLKIPLSVVSFAIGAIIAFVPVDGRPMDIMIGNFFRALLSPTEYIYEKEGGKLTKTLSMPPVAINKLNSSQQIQGPAPITPPPALPKDETKHHEKPDKTNPPHHSLIHDLRESFEHKKTEKEKNEIKEIKEENEKLHDEIEEVKKSIEKSQEKPQPQMIAPNPIPQPPPPPPAPSFSGMSGDFIPPVPISEENTDAKEIEKKNKEIEEIREEKDKLLEEIELLKKQLDDAIKEKEEIKASPPPPPTPPPPPQISPAQNELEKKLIESNREKEALEKELVSIKAKSQEPTKQTFNPIVAKPLESSQRVRSIPQGMEKSAGIPSVPDAPNLITGIVKDPRGNPIQNILIEVKDQDSNPVRAFKTNGFGKFASATSLSNGKYVISFEDPKETHKFDSVELELVGAPVMPLEIISVDPREELRRELFN